MSVYDNIDEYHFTFIDRYFKDNTLVDHHIKSCNYFYEEAIPKIFRDTNPLKYYSTELTDSELATAKKSGIKETYKYRSRIYFGGKNVDKIYYGKPVIFDENNTHYMFPNEARLRNMTYGISIHYDVEIETDIYDNGKIVTVETKVPQQGHFFLGMFPIMVQSNLCVLNGLPPETKYHLGECKHDYGGYFIINGKEKVLIPQESFGNNLIYIREPKDDKHDYSVEIRSVSEDISKPRRTLAIRRVKGKSSLTNENIVVFIPDVRVPIPLFILMRALGINSDEEICKTILHDLKGYEHYLELLRPSIHDAGYIFNQQNALEYIGSCTKIQSISEAYKCLVYQLLPHVGEMNFKAKASYIGYMVFEMLKVINKDESITDRDSYKYKRVVTSGKLMEDLFLEYLNEMRTEVYKSIDRKFFKNKAIYIDTETPIEKNYKFIHLFTDEHFTNVRYIENGFRKGFKGNWGAKSHTKRIGAIQSLNRLTYHTFISHLRLISLDIDVSNKLVGPHLLHGSQWGLLDPIDVGGSVGIDKQLTLMAKITESIPLKEVIQWIVSVMTDDDIRICYLEECDHNDIYKFSRLFINGTWIGMIENPMKFKNLFLNARRLGFIPFSISISFHIKSKTINIFSDGGRLIRPLFYFENQKVSYETNKKEALTLSWNECVQGKINTENYGKMISKFDDKSILPILKSETTNKKAIIEYIDNFEAESSYITTTMDNIVNKKEHSYSHIEIHPSLIFGVMGSQVVFPENSALARNDYSCIQGRQAISIYHSNFLNRIDTAGVVIDYGQKPLVKSRYTKYINSEEHPYGQNAIVAIMAHTGYNVEDSILFNEGSINRGLFNITYYSMYETYEETSGRGKATNEKRIAHPIHINANGIKPGFSYDDLDERGIIKEGTLIDETSVIIGKIEYSSDNPSLSRDVSITASKGHSGIVDKVYITDDEEGKRIVKVRIREERKPNIGDKFSSRCGQKGTVGTLIAERDMPFTKDGLRPDLIINPHCIPSRMTINQLIECTFSKVGITKGNAIDSTPFINKGPKNELIGSLLNQYNFHSTGNEILYNGMNGEQIESVFFMGPTYYTRLKHMVKDKINYRAGGLRDALTRQTNHGRARGGGLRIGDMERDGVIAHGMSSFMYDSMMTRGDSYRMAICNQTGTIAVYNRDNDSFYSPIVDGPLSFDKVDNETFVPHLITRYGKEFSIVEVPYCFKLLMQELASMNVQMRIITADNIESLTTIGKNSLGNMKEWLKEDIKSTIERPEINKSNNSMKQIIKKTEALMPIQEENTIQNNEIQNIPISQNNIQPSEVPLEEVNIIPDNETIKIIKQPEEMKAEYESSENESSENESPENQTSVKTIQLEQKEA
jgi:DNA-directed RNA polymerase II subunit RPB2